MEGRVDRNSPIISPEELQQFVDRYGRRAANTLSILGKYEPFIQACQSELGQELLKDDMIRHEFLLEKIYNETATPQESAEFRYLKKRLLVVSERIKIWLDEMKKVKNN